MGTDTPISQQDKQITVDVPAERVPEFYAFFARFLAAGEGGGRRRGGRRGPGGRGFGPGHGPGGGRHRHCHHREDEAHAHEAHDGPASRPGPAGPGDAPARA